jgi:cobalt-zinc-cadmium efflux system protein
MATDAIGLGMALAAITVSSRASANAGRTYGLYRLEILAALTNAALLLGVAGYVVVEAIARMQDPPEVRTGPMLIVAIGGLVVNIVGWRLLRSGAEESLNVKVAYYEVIADLVGSLGVIAAALVMITTGWVYADALFAGLIGLFIIPRALTLGHQALRILIQAAPEGIDLNQVTSNLLTIAGLCDVHDLHVWTLTSGMEVATAHIATTTATDPHPVLDEAHRILTDHHGIAHGTLQIEPETHDICGDIPV